MKQDTLRSVARSAFLPIHPSNQTNKQKDKTGWSAKEMGNKANMYVAENGHSFAFQDSTRLYLRAFLDFN